MLLLELSLSPSLVHLIFIKKRKEIKLESTLEIVANHNKLRANAPHRLNGIRRCASKMCMVLLILNARISSYVPFSDNASSFHHLMQLKINQKSKSQIIG